MISRIRIVTYNFFQRRRINEIKFWPVLMTRLFQSSLLCQSDPACLGVLQGVQTLLAGSTVGCGPMNMPATASPEHRFCETTPEQDEMCVLGNCHV